MDTDDRAFPGGYCDYDCNKCGQICPARRSTPFAEDKRKAVIGIAQVNYETCARCMACLEECPYKCFVELEVEGSEEYSAGDSGKVRWLRLMRVVCPKQEERAIVVYPWMLSA